MSILTSQQHTAASAARSRRPHQNLSFANLPVIPGGRAPTFKTVSDNLDTEDQIIFDMKRQGHKDDAVVAHLVNQGLTTYKPQSITARYARIKKKMQQSNEELLDAELTDWHEGEVDKILPCPAVLLLR